jgi:quercetin dioxygenase-like cupin family protein
MAIVSRDERIYTFAARVRGPGRFANLNSRKSLENPGSFAASMEIIRNGSRPSVRGTSELFTGNVRIDLLHQTQPPARAQCQKDTFDRGARTAWHSHPLGQTLIVLSGEGLVQSWGGTIERLRPGDVVWSPPGEKHWHGASPTTSLVQIAVQEALNGKVVDGMEKVPDDQYLSSMPAIGKDTRPA